MFDVRPHECGCEICQCPDPHPLKAWHRHLNLLLAYSDERQRRWVAALEALRLGYGGIRAVARIAGLDVKTIRRGQHELEGRRPRVPVARVRRAGAGRPRAEKNSHGY